MKKNFKLVVLGGTYLTRDGEKVSVIKFLKGHMYCYVVSQERNRNTSFEYQVTKDGYYFSDEENGRDLITYLGVNGEIMDIKKDLTLCQRYWLDKYRLRGLFFLIVIVGLMTGFSISALQHTENFLHKDPISFGFGLVGVVIMCLMYPSEEMLQELFILQNKAKIADEVVCPLTPIIEGLEDND